MKKKKGMPQAPSLPSYASDKAREMLSKVVSKFKGKKKKNK